MEDIFENDIEDDFGTDLIKVDKVAEKSIIDDLRPYNLPDDIMTCANRIFVESKITNVKKKKKIDMFFFYTLQAYQQLQIPIDPEILAKIFGIDNRKIPRCYNFQTLNSFPVTGELNPEHFISYYAKKMDGILSNDDEKNIIKMYQICNELDKDFSDQKPQIISKVMIYYYLKSQGKEIDIKKIASLENHINISTFHKIYREVEKLLSG